VHGLATLLVNGNLGRRASADPIGTARRIGALTSPTRPDRGPSDSAGPSVPLPGGSGR
jgi:hypothetical protein